MFAIYKKELRSYFVNPHGYVFAGIFLVLSSLVFSYTTLLSQSYDTSLYFMVMVFAYTVLMPLLTMRLFTEEKKLRTEQLLLTAPVTITGMVTGKFLAAFTLYFSCTLLSCINFIPLYAIAAAERGNLSYDTTHIGPVTPQIIGCLIGIILIGAAFIAIGTFISSLTENQLAAAIITIAVLISLVAIGLFTSIIDIYWLRMVISWISVFSRFGNFSAGVFDVASLIYFLSLTFVFLFLTVRVYEKRRYN